MTPPRTLRTSRRVAVAFLLLVCAAALGLVNAQGPRAPDPSPQDPNPQETAAVRVLRLGGSAATVDVWIGDAQAITGLEPMVVSEYVEVPSGERAVAVRPSGEDDAGDALTPIGHVALQPGGYATLLTFDRDAGAAGGVDESPSSAPPPLVRIVDPLDRLPPVGHAGVRLVHAAPGVPMLALVTRPADGTRETAPLFPSSDDEASGHLARVAPLHGSSYSPIEAGRYRLWLIGEEGGSALAEPLTLSVRAGVLYTLYVVAGAEQGAVRALPTVDAVGLASFEAGGGDAPTAEQGASTAALRLLHASPDAPLVDVVIDGRLRLRDVSRRIHTRYVWLPAGRHEVRVFPHRLPGASGPGGDGSEQAGADDDVAAPPTRTLEPVTALVDLRSGEHTTLALAGRFEPPAMGGERGALSVAVDPADASLSVEGPDGVVAEGQGAQLLDDLQPGTYRIDVHKQGYRSVRYQVEVRPGGTSVVSATLQEGGEEDGDDDASGFVQDESAQGVRRRLELQSYPSEVPLARAGGARVRFVHLAPSAPHLEIGAWSRRTPAAADGDGDGDGAGDDGDPGATVTRIERLAYPNASDYLPLPAGRYRWTFRVAGTENVVHEVPEMQLRPGVSYTVYLVPPAAGGSIELLPVVDAIVLVNAVEGGGP